MKKSLKKKNNLRFGLKGKLFIVFFFIAGIPILFFSLRAQSIVKEELETQTKESIKSDANLTLTAVNLWKARNETEILRLTDTGSPLVEAFLDYSQNNDKSRIREILDRSLFNTPNYLEMVIMDPISGEVLVSTNPSSEDAIGINPIQIPTRRKRISPIFFSKHLDSFTMTIENPVKNENGNVLAVVGIYINLQSLRPVFLNANTINNHGESYLVNPEGKGIIQKYSLDPTRIQEYLSIEITEPSEYINHKGKEVIGYHEYLPDLNVVFVDEHETSLLFEPLKELNQRIWIIAAIIFLLSLLFAYFLVDHFTKPIKELTKTSQKIADGHYNLRSNISSSDEIGILSQAFNQMANSLTNTLKDVSLKNALLESQYNASIFGQLSIGLKNEILSWNKSFEEVWETPKGLLSRNDIFALIQHCAKKTKDPANFIKTTNDFMTYQKKESHDIVEMKNNRIVERLSSPLLSDKNKVLGRIFFCRDISKEVEVNKTKNEFVSLATHQLLTPLTAIRWLLENLSTSLKKDKESYQLVRDASSSTERIIQLVSDMLNVSRLDSGQLGINSKKTDVGKFLEKMIEEAQPIAEKKKISIEFKKPAKKIETSLDEDLIAEVILNLFSNSIRFSDPKKKIVVSLKKEGSRILIAIKDQGIGISKKDQKELFTKFFRTDQASRYNTTGSGLGLYVIKKIIDACKGSIRIHSIEGKGSTFTVILPLKGPVQLEEKSKLLIHKGITV